MPGDEITEANKPKNPYLKGNQKSTNKVGADYNALLEKQLETFGKEGKDESFYKRQQRLLKEKLKEQRVTTKDIEYGKAFVDAVEKKKRNSPNGKCFFDMELLDAVPFPKRPKLVFYYGAKNIGKTYSQATYFNKRLAEFPTSQIMMIRTTREEVINGLTNQLNGDEGPFYYVKNSRVLRRKTGRLPERGEFKRQRGPHKKIEVDEGVENIKMPATMQEMADVCGGATGATGSGFRSFQGSGWKNLTDIVWDEFNDIGSASEGLSEDMFARFLVFVLSLERNNKDLRIWLFGNLLRHDSGVAANIALNMFKIPYNCNLKYGEFPNSGTPAVYINLGRAGELFTSVEEQKFTDMFGTEMSKDLYTNLPESITSKTLNLISFCKAEPVYSFIYEFEEVYYIIYIGRMINRRDNQAYYIMHVDKYSPSCYYPGYFPITDSVEIYNQFGGLRYQKPKKVAKLIKKIRKLQKNQRLFFSGDDIRFLYCNQMAKRLVAQYKKEINGDI